MRQTIKKRKTQKKKEKLIAFLTFFIFAPIVAILIGSMIVKYTIYPLFTSKDELSVVNDNKNTIENSEMYGNDENKDNSSTDEENDIATEKTETLQLNINGINLFNVQVGSFSNLENATELAAKMKEQGLGGYIVQTENYKVFAGSFYNREEAEKLLSNVKKLHKDAFIATIIINERTIDYYSNEQKYADVLIELSEIIKNAYGEETSLWLNALLEKDTELLVEVLKTNTNSIETKLLEIKNKASSDGLKSIVNDIDNLITKRKSIISSLEKSTQNILDAYISFNESLFNYGFNK
jgi:hypothetical protein